ncbi:alpha/beta hydrolase [Actinomadura rudentiformis]|uniref:Alpha/beta hydrolase n=1 Tax=Actinomadura rudentiformis TaxID=359158 RepID=A0A6H9YYR4_9ACTN|nr:alpha/beta hydrolase [Actinomadura rudentiformis]KAB2349484.1 alpha/beta hydrolase [Actinomadura rudentiformis]
MKPTNKTSKKAGQAVGIVMVTALVSAGCSLIGSDDGADAKRPPAAALEQFYTQKISWKDCGQGFQCGTLKVPLDYSKPGGEKIDIAVNRLRASDERQGSVLLNPGGPGASGLEAARGSGPAMDRQLRERFDIVGFDPRGVGKSTPVSCPSGSTGDGATAGTTSGTGATDTTGTTDTDVQLDTETRLELQAARLTAAACQKTSARLLPHVGTVNAARDMDVLRAVLGDRRLNYVGWSYGSELGATYANMFPDRIRTMVLDGATDLSQGYLQQQMAQAKGREATLRAFVADCLKIADCPLKSAGTVEAGVKRITELRESADLNPLSNSTTDGTSLDGFAVTNAIGAALYDKANWPLLSEALTSAITNRDGTALYQFLIDTEGLIGIGQYEAVTCADHPRFDRATALQAAENAKREAPNFSDALVKTAWMTCESWAAPATKKVPVPRAEGSAPILVVGTANDPATPYEASKALVKQLDNARLISYDGSGHSAYLKAGSNCINDRVHRYLIETELPKEGLHCPAI